MNEPGQSSHGLASGEFLLGKDNNARMTTALGEPPAVHRDAIANVVGYQHPAGSMRGLQLPVVINSAESKVIGSFGVNSVLLEGLRQRVGLTVLVQMDPDSAHAALCSRHSRGLGRLSAQAVFAFNFTGNLLQV